MTRTREEEDSPDNVKFPDNSPTFPWQFAALLPMLSVTCIMPVLPNTGMDANTQLTINSFRQFFPDEIFSLTFPWLLVKSLTFPWQLSNSLTFPGFSYKWSLWIQGVVSQTKFFCNQFRSIDFPWGHKLPSKTPQLHYIAVCDWCHN